MAEKRNNGIARTERKRDIFHEISLLRNRLAKAEKAAKKEYLYDSDDITHTDEANDERPGTLNLQVPLCKEIL